MQLNRLSVAHLPKCFSELPSDCLVSLLPLIQQMAIWILVTTSIISGSTCKPLSLRHLGPNKAIHSYILILSSAHMFMFDTTQCEHHFSPLMMAHFGYSSAWTSFLWVLDRKGKRDTVSIDRLKTAYLEDDITSNVKTPGELKEIPPATSTLPLTPPRPVPDGTATRSGCHFHWPARYAQYCTTGT